MTQTFPFHSEMPNREQFDAMNDATFFDWWDAFRARVSASDPTDSEMENFEQARCAAETERMA